MIRYEIPITPATNQEFPIVIAGVRYSLRLAYFPEVEGGWALDINFDDKTPVICGIPLVTGIDLLEQYAYKELGFKLGVVTSGDPSALPTFQSLGALSHLYVEVAN